MRILVVDDEALPRTKLQRILKRFGQCDAVDSGLTARTAIRDSYKKKEPYDLITLDVVMPDMDGTEVLYEIRALEKSLNIPEGSKVKILMVTGQSDKDTIITSIQAGCDDYIVKPLDAKKIIDKVSVFEKTAPPDAVAVKKLEESPSGDQPKSERVSIGQEVLESFKRGEVNLASPSNLPAKFKELVQQGASIREMAEFLRQDMTLSLHLINVSNSPHYRGMRENKNLVQAIGRLGVDVTRRYVDRICLKGTYKAANKKYDPYVKQLWEHSLACAQASELLAQMLKFDFASEAFTMGLMHDVGKLVLMLIVNELEMRNKIDMEDGGVQLLNSLETFHMQFGAVTLEKWRFPKEFINIALYHDNISGAGAISKELAVVYLTNLIVRDMGYGEKLNDGTKIENLPSAKNLFLDSGKINRIRDQVKIRMEE